MTVAHADCDYAGEQIEVSFPLVVKQPLLVPLQRRKGSRSGSFVGKTACATTNLRDKDRLGVIRDECGCQVLLPDFERLGVRLSLHERQQDSPHSERSSTSNEQLFSNLVRLGLEVTWRHIGNFDRSYNARG